jgi:hypothetical protein
VNKRTATLGTNAADVAGEVVTACAEAVTLLLTIPAPRPQGHCGDWEQQAPEGDREIAIPDAAVTTSLRDELWKPTNINFIHATSPEAVKGLLSVIPTHSHGRTLNPDATGPGNPVRNAPENAGDSHGDYEKAQDCAGTGQSAPHTGWVHVNIIDGMMPNCSWSQTRSGRRKSAGGRRRGGRWMMGLVFCDG